LKYDGYIIHLSECAGNGRICTCTSPFLLPKNGSLKNKVAASIVAISSIHLLRVFMDAHNIPDNKLMWYVNIHLTFVLSALVMGYLDRMSRLEKKAALS